MARPKSYSVSDVVAQVTHAFWQHGYQALGVRELEQLTGLNQYAIRTEFGGKEGLYLAALEFYSEQAITHSMRPMQTGGVKDVISFLRGLVTSGSMTSSPFGCLVVNTGIENVRIGSPRLEAAVKSYWEALERHFLLAISNSIANGELKPDTDANATSKGLVAGVMGVHASNRTGNSYKAGSELVDLLCAQLRSLILQ